MTAVHASAPCARCSILLAGRRYQPPSHPCTHRTRAAAAQAPGLPLPERMQLDVKRRQEKQDERVRAASQRPPASAQLAFNVEDMLAPYVMWRVCVCV